MLIENPVKKMGFWQKFDQAKLSILHNKQFDHCAGSDWRRSGRRRRHRLQLPPPVLHLNQLLGGDRQLYVLWTLERPEILCIRPADLRVQHQVRGSTGRGRHCHERHWHWMLQYLGFLFNGPESFFCSLRIQQNMNEIISCAVNICDTNLAF